jgi:hypothetical protein
MSHVGGSWIAGRILDWLVSFGNWFVFMNLPRLSNQRGTDPFSFQYRGTPKLFIYVGKVTGLCIPHTLTLQAFCFTKYHKNLFVNENDLDFNLIYLSILVYSKVFGI